MTITDEQAARLRAQVPDDPIKVPAAHLGCEVCGIAVPVPGPLCEQCEETRAAAVRYVEEHRGLIARLGDRAVPRIESLLIALRILNVAAPADLGMLLPRFWPVTTPFEGETLKSGSWMPPKGMSESEAFDKLGARRYTFPCRDLAFGKQGSRCNAKPFDHVLLAKRRELRRAYIEVEADRLSLAKPNVVVRCPSGACLMCGVTTVERSAIEVRRRGQENVARDAWRRVSLPKYAGHYSCLSCSQAIEEEGSLGPSAMLTAVLAHVRATMGERQAINLRHRIAEGSVSLPMWIEAPGQRLSGNRFGHLIKTFDLIAPRGPRVAVGPMVEV